MLLVVPGVVTSRETEDSTPRPWKTTDDRYTGTDTERKATRRARDGNIQHCHCLLWSGRVTDEPMPAAYGAASQNGARHCPGLRELQKQCGPLDVLPQAPHLLSQ